jgi:hypothetical protein
MEDADPAARLDKKGRLFRGVVLVDCQLAWRNWNWMSASLADSADRLPAWQIGLQRAGSPPAESGWQPDIPLVGAPTTDNLNQHNLLNRTGNYSLDKRMRFFKAWRR